jgi:hypothetical protein
MYPLQMKLCKTNQMVGVANTIIWKWTFSRNRSSNSYTQINCPIFFLTLSPHQHSPLRYFIPTFPDTVDLQIGKQTCELHLSNKSKQARIVVLKLPFVVLWTLILIF